MIGIAYLVLGIIGWVQALWLPIYIGISEENEMIWAVCENCRAFIWIPSTIAIIMGGILLFTSQKKPEQYKEVMGRGTISLFVCFTLITILTVF